MIFELTGSETLFLFFFLFCCWFNTSLLPSYFFNQKNETTDWKAYEDQNEDIIKKCADAIRQLKDKALDDSSALPQYKDHLENMFYLLEKYLKDVCKIYTEQKAIRVTRVVERNNL